MIRSALAEAIRDEGCGALIILGSLFGAALVLACGVAVSMALGNL